MATTRRRTALIAARVSDAQGDVAARLTPVLRRGWCTVTTKPCSNSNSNNSSDGGSGGGGVGGGVCANWVKRYLVIRGATLESHKAVCENMKPYKTVCSTLCFYHVYMYSLFFFFFSLSVTL
jgi:hypothetical protein